MAISICAVRIPSCAGIRRSGEPGGAAASWAALLAITAVMLSTWWVPRLRIAIVSGVPYMAVLTVAYWLVRKNQRHLPQRTRRNTEEMP